MATELEQKEQELVDERDSYDELFDAIADGEELEADSTPESEASADDGATSPSTKASEDDGKPSSQSKSSESTEEENDPHAWIEALPEEFREQAKALRENYDKRENEYRAQVGRVRSLQERLDEERARRAAAAQASQPSQQSKKTPDGEVNEELPEDLKKLQKEYPDLYKVVKTMSDHEIKRVLPQIEEKIRPLNEEVSVRKHQENLRKFEAAANEILDTDNTGVTYRDVFASEEYADFLSQQPQYVQRMARTSTDPEEAAWILKQYVDRERVSYLEQELQSAGKKPSSTQERRKKLETNVSPRSKSANMDSEAGMDYNSWFDHFAES